MEKLKNWNPSSWDSRANYMGTNDYDEYFVVYCKTRDSNSILCESNWEILCKELHAEENNGVEIVRFGHWACGHYDLLLVSPDSKELSRAEEFYHALENYPVLSDDHYSNKMFEAESEAFNNIESDFRYDLENKFVVDTDNGCDLSDVPLDVLWEYFDTCCKDSNTNWEDSDNGLCISLNFVVKAATLEGMIRSLLGIKIHSELLKNLSHKFLHEMTHFGIGVTDLEGNRFEIPDFIVVQHNPNQLTLLK